MISELEGDRDAALRGDAQPRPDVVGELDVVRSDRDGCALTRGNLDPLTVGQSSRERAVVRGQCGRDGLDTRAEARAEDLEVRSSSPSTEHIGRPRDLDALDVQLLGNRIPQSIERSRRVGEMHHRGGKRLPRSGLRLRADPPPQLHDLTRERHRVVQARVERRLVHPRIVRQMDRVRPPAASGGEVRPDLLGDERGERREERRRGDQALVQRVERGHALGAATPARVPEATARASYVPIGQVLDERLDPATSSRHVVAVHPVPDLANGAGESRQDPSVQKRSGGRRRSGLGVGIEHVRVRVEHEERVDVPQGEQELSHRLFEDGVAESPRRPGGAARQEHPAERVRSVTLHHGHRIHDVAERLRHLPALFVDDEPETHDRAVRGRIEVQDPLRHQRVEPAPGLVDRFGDEVRGEPSFERLLAPAQLRVVAPLRERHRAGVVPGVDHLGDPS